MATYIISIGINNKSNSEVKLTSNRPSATRRWQRQASGEALHVRFVISPINCSSAYEDSEYSGEFHDAQDLEGKDWPIGL